MEGNSRRGERVEEIVGGERENAREGRRGRMLGEGRVECGKEEKGCRSINDR